MLLIFALATISILVGLDTYLNRPQIPGMDDRVVRSLQIMEDGVLRPYMDRGLLARVVEHVASGRVTARMDMRASVRTNTGAEFELPIELVESGYFSSLGVPVRADWDALRSQSEAARREVVVSRHLLQAHPGMQAVSTGDSLWINETVYQVVDVLEGAFAGTSTQPVGLWMPLSAFVAEGIPVGRATRNVPAIIASSDAISHAALEIASNALRREGVFRPNQSLSAQPLASVGGLPQGVAAQARSLGVLGGFLFAFSWMSALAFLALRTLQGSAHFAVHRLLGAQARHLVMAEAIRALKHGAAVGLGACLGSWIFFNLLRSHVPGLSALDISWATLMAASWPAWLALWSLATLTLWVLPLLLVLPRLDSRSVQATRQLELGRLALSIGLVGQATLTGVFVLFALQSWSSYREELRFGHGFGLDGYSILHTDRESTPGAVVFTSRENRERERREVLELLSREGRYRSAAVSRFPGAPGRLGTELVSIQRTGRDSDVRSAIPVSATADFFGLAGVPVLAGSTFDETAVEGDVVLGQELARRLFDTPASAIGQGLQLRVSEDARPISINVVGVVADVFLAGRAAGPSPVLYRPAAHGPELNWTFLVEQESGHDLAGLDEALRGIGSVFRPRNLILAQNNPEIVAGSQAMQAWIGAGVALLLAALAAVSVGVVGVFVVQRRLRELAIRLSLGAAPTYLGRGVLLRSMAEALAGYAVGILFVGPLVLRLIDVDAHALSSDALILAMLAATGAWLVALLPALYRVLSLQPAGLLRQA